MPTTFQLVVPPGFQLVVDLAPPIVEWGAVGGASAGELLQVAYTSDEPIATARLQLADGRWLTMTIDADRLSVLLPPDTVQGWATVEVADDVGNTATTTVLLQGVAMPEGPPRSPGGVPTRTPTRRRTFTRRSTIAVSRTTRAVVTVRERATVVVTSRIEARLVSTTARRRASSVTPRARRSTTAALGTRTSLQVNVTRGTRRGDDPEIEALLALGVL